MANLTCPDCGHENEAGLTACSACERSLTEGRLDITGSAGDSTASASEIVAGTLCPDHEIPVSPGDVCPYCGWAPAPDPVSANTTRDPSSETTTTSILHSLPPEIESDHELIGELEESGGEAFMLEVRYIPDGSRRLLKHYYQRGFKGDANALQAMEDDETGRPHVVRLFQTGVHQRRRWELLEYVSTGSLRDMLEAEGPKLSEDRIHELVEEILIALEYLHGLQIAHCDLKPENVLIRTKNPLDTVLCDFGSTTSMGGMTAIEGIVGGSIPYSAPESAIHHVSNARDYWSLGVIVYEAATGGHPLRVDGEWLDDLPMRTFVNEKHFDLTKVSNERLRLLCAGLLVKNPPEARWGAEEVREWLDGGSPEVPEAVEEKRAKAVIPFAYHDPASRQRVQFRDGVELARALRADWSRAADTLENPDERADLKDFLRGWAPEEVDRTFEANAPAERMLVMLLIALDPSAPPVFAGKSVSSKSDHLYTLAMDAARTNDHRLVDRLKQSKALRIYSRLDGEDELAEIDSRWSDISKRALGIVSSLDLESEQQDADAAARLITALSLAAAVDPERAIADVNMLTDSVAHSEIDAVEWYAVMQDRMRRNINDRTAGTIAAFVVAPVASEQAEEAAKARAAARAKARADAVNRIARAVFWSVGGALLCGAVLLLFTWLLAITFTFDPSMDDGSRYIVEPAFAALWPSAAVATGIIAVGLLAVQVVGYLVGRSPFFTDGKLDWRYTYGHGFLIAAASGLAMFAGGQIDSLPDEYYLSLESLKSIFVAAVVMNTALCVSWSLLLWATDRPRNEVMIARSVAVGLPVLALVFSFLIPKLFQADAGADFQARSMALKATLPFGPGSCHTQHRGDGSAFTADHVLARAECNVNGLTYEFRSVDSPEAGAVLLGALSGSDLEPYGDLCGSWGSTTVKPWKYGTGEKEISGTLVCKEEGLSWSDDARLLVGSITGGTRAGMVPRWQRTVAQTGDSRAAVEDAPSAE